MALVMFSIGPVQRFISEARRTHDLFLGSQLLSYLMFHAISAVPDYESRVIYPRLAKDTGKNIVQARNQRLPNRLIFIGQDSPVEDAEKVEAAIRGAWRTVCEAVWKHMTEDKKYAPDLNHKLWETQVDNWLEIYWVISDGSDYRQQMRQVQDLLDARKLMKHVPTLKARGVKSTLSGTFQALHAKESDQPRKAIQRYWSEIREKVAEDNPSLLREGERLSAIDVVKRFAHDVKDTKLRETLGEVDRFPSTASIATATFRLQLLEQWEEMQEHVWNYLNILKRMRVNFSLHEPYPFISIKAQNDSAKLNLLCYDGDFFFPETLREVTIKDYVKPADVAEALQYRDAALEKLLVLRKKASDLGLASPSAYYAILMMDGDGMGQYINQLTEQTEHRDFSQALAEFAQAAQTICEKNYPGRLVYSGGDDVLALFPIDCVLEAAEALRNKFTQHMTSKGFAGLHASAGIAIVHQAFPLDLALEAARQAEGAAKRKDWQFRTESQQDEPTPDKAEKGNAVAVYLMRRSGEHHEMGCQWEYLPSQNISNLVIKIRDWYKAEDGLSSHFPFDLEELAYGMHPVVDLEKAAKSKENEGQSTEAIDIPAEAREYMLKLILKRRTPNEKVFKNVETDLSAPLISLGEKYGWESVAAWARLARFLAQGGSE